MKEKDVSNFDQAVADLVRTWPMALFSFYSGLVKEGFDKNQAMILTIEWFKHTLMGNNEN